jgi:hypothetical protein
MGCDEHIKAWVRLKRPKRAAGEIASLLAVCSTCASFAGDRCGKSGLRISDRQTAGNALFRANERCPDGKWSSP